MKERPILFSGAMVRAILEGRKTQTRRVCKQADFSKGMLPGGDWAKAVYPARESGWIAWQGIIPAGPELEAFTKKTYQHGFPCPYGKPGDRLWVRETWRPTWSATANAMVVEYRAGGEYAPKNAKTGGKKEPAGWALTCLASDGGTTKWRPSIFMPRWASRITLEVAGVRVERVQDISEEDAQAEGADQEFRTVVMSPSGCKDYHIPNSYRGGYANLWDEINTKRGYGWDVNPWVWVVAFCSLS